MEISKRFLANFNNFYHDKIEYCKLKIVIKMSIRNL